MSKETKGQAWLDAILTDLTVSAGEEYHKLHIGKQSFELTNEGMKFYENRAKAAINQKFDQTNQPLGNMEHWQACVDAWYGTDGTKPGEE